MRVTTDYTGLPNQFVKASNSAKITFPATPNEGDRFVVKNADGSAIQILGNGRLINGSSSGIIRKRNTCIDFYYFLDDDSWDAT